LSRSVAPSVEPCSPLERSFSTGPQPFVAEVQVRSLRKTPDVGVGDGAGGALVGFETVTVRCAVVRLPAPSRATAVSVWLAFVVVLESQVTP
jgi:hypothetical protein